jgi:hypothetical protein
MSAGDNDLAACACDLGMGVGVFKALRLTHLIPPARLREDYLEHLQESIAFSAVLMRSFRSTECPRERSLKNRIADALRATLMNRRSRRMYKGVIRGERRAVAYLRARRGSRDAVT